MNYRFVYSVFLTAALLAIPVTASVGVGLRAGYYLIPNWSDSYDTVYDNGGEATFGIEFDYRFSESWEIGLAIDSMTGEGNRVWPTGSGDWRNTNEKIEFDLLKTSLFTRYKFFAEQAFSPFLGAGIGYAVFEETDDDSEAGVGLIGLLGLSYMPSDNFRMMLEGEYSSYPDVIGTGDVSKFYDEDDIGGITLRFVICYQF